MAVSVTDREIKPAFESPFYFFPPLVEQRRSFCLGFLKRQAIRSALELGCGDGTLIGLLTNVSNSLDDFPPLDLELQNATRNLSNDQASIERLQRIKNVVKQIPQPEVHQRDLRLKLLIGLDLDPQRLQRAHELIKMANRQDTPDLFHSFCRWEPLKVELWQGDLAVNNERFADLECVLMSEVIEHLLPQQFDRSIPLLFGNYRPEWIVITTPNYEFNQHIDQYSTSDRHRFLDPTGRTNRYFRDSDHKFEWTREEFTQWCQSISSTYAYDYDITGCGSYKQYFDQSALLVDISCQFPKAQLPAPENPQRFFATQIVIFHRRPGGPSIPMEIALLDKMEINERQKLIADENFRADEHAGKTASRTQILNRVKDYLVGTQRQQVRLRELWLCNPGLDQLCGGRLIELVVSFSVEDGWEVKVDDDLHQNPSTGMDAVWITWLHFPSKDSEIRKRL